MLDGRISIQHWQQRGVYLPFSALWYKLSEMSSAKAVWQKPRDWVRAQHTISQSLRDCLSLAFSTISWALVLEERSTKISLVEFSDLRSTKWLSDQHIDTMLHRTALETTRPYDIVASTAFIRHIMDCKDLTRRVPRDYEETAPVPVRHIANQVRDHPHSTRIFTVAYSKSHQWVYILIDLSQDVVLWQDHLAHSPRDPRRA